MDDSLAVFCAFGNFAFAAFVLLTALVALAVSSITRRTWRVRAVSSLLAALAVGAALVVSGGLAMRSVGDPLRDVERVDARTFTTRRRWTNAQGWQLRRASMSPLHRGAVKALLDAPARVEASFPPADERTLAAVRAWARAHGRCDLDVRLDRALGDFERARSAHCETPEGLRAASEAAFAMGDVDGAFARIAPVRSTVHDGWDVRLLALRAHPTMADLDAEPATPAHEATLWRCVRERLRQRALGDRDATVWDAMLTSDVPQCRMLAATAPARRDAMALRAITRLPPTAQRTWRAALASSRALIAVSGRVEAVPCLSRRVPTPDAAWLARYPSFAEEMLRAVSHEGCAFAVDRLWFPAMRARAWAAWGDPVRGDMAPFEDLIVGWQLVDNDWEKMRTLWDSRYTRRRRSALERAFRESLLPVSSWAVARLDAQWAAGNAWPMGFSWMSVQRMLDELPARRGWDHEAVLRSHDIPHYAIDTARRWDLDVVRVPAHNPILDAWVDYWRTGSYAPAHDAPAWFHDASMRAVVEAAREGEAREVLRALGDATIPHAEQLAVVAYRTRGDTAVFEAWLRRAWGSFDASAAPLATWEEALQTLRTCAMRLRLPVLRGEVEAALVRVRAMRAQADGMVLAVLDGPRPAPPPPDEDDE